MAPRLSFLVVLLGASAFAQGQAAPATADRCYGKACVVKSLAAGQGTAAAPTVTFSGAPTTGLYRIGATSLGMSFGGVSGLSFQSGVIMNGNFGQLQISNVGAGMTATAGGQATSFNVFTDGATMGVGYQGLSFNPAGGFPVNWTATRTATIHHDQGTGRIWFRETTTPAATPPYDLGGFPHPVLQRRAYVVDIGTESAVAPTWQVAPRVGATTATVTVAEATNAATTVGAAPYVWDLRTSSTSSVSGNTASLITTAFAKRNRGPRWCARVLASSKTSVRLWAGLSSALPGSSDTPSANNHASFRLSTAASDANWQACSSDGTTQTCTDTTVTADTTAGNLLCIDCRSSTTCTYWVDGVARVAKTNNLPAAATNMAPFHSVETLSAAVRSLSTSSISVEVN